MMKHCEPLTTCLACGSSNLTLQLNLGEQALANEFVNAGERQSKYPLAVNRCTHCNHLQLTHVVDPALIYTHYLYVSGTSKTGRDHFEWFANWAEEYMNQIPIPRTNTVLDIGCNDGTQLDYFRALGYKTFGVDPAKNLYETSSKNHTVYCDFFGPELIDRLVVDGMQPDIIVAQNSFAHNPNPAAYLESLKKIMGDSSRFFIQTSQSDMILNNEFDTIYHEHVNFYSINSMNELCNRAGMHLIDAIKSPIHGTSYIFVVSKSGGRPQHIKNLIAIEAGKGLMSDGRYNEWSDTVESLKTQLCRKLIDAKEMGYAVIGYGAAAKGNTLLNYLGTHCDIENLVDAIIDDNPLKQGLVSPGAHIPVVGIDYLDSIGAERTAVFVPLAWNFYSEIKARILAKRNGPGDLFLKYFPKVELEGSQSGL